MKQFKHRITATVGMILIALALIGVNADQAIAQAKARKGAKVRSGGSNKIATARGRPFFVPTLDMDTQNAKTTSGSASAIISPRDPASGMPTGSRVDKTGSTSLSSYKNELSIDTIKRGRRGRAQLRTM